MKRRDWGSMLLGLGAALGAVVAAIGIIQNGPTTSTAVPSEAVAVVNGAPILQSDYQRALRALAADLQETPVSAGTRRRVLDRLIEQELLVQRGLELDLAKRDPRIRATLTDAVIGSLVARGEAPKTAPDEAELRSFYATHPDYFRQEPRLQLQRLWFSVRTSGGPAQARARAQAAQRRLAAGESFQSLSHRDDEPPAPLPEGWLPLAKVRDYLGPSASAAAAKLDTGRSSQPLPVAGGYTIVRVVARRAGRLEPFEAMRGEVAAVLRRQQGDRVLRSFLDERRREARITIAEERL